MRVWLGATALLCSALVACTPGGATEPTPTPTPPASSATPPESEMERRQRLDFEAAEKAYREFTTEYNRVLRAGGASDATSIMKQTATGPFLAEHVPVVQAYKSGGYHDEGIAKIIFMKRVAHLTDGAILEICEDSRAVRALSRDGKVRGRGELRIDRLEIQRTEGQMKIANGDGKVVKSCDGSSN